MDRVLFSSPLASQF